MGEARARGAGDAGPGRFATQQRSPGTCQRIYRRPSGSEATDGCGSAALQRLVNQQTNIEDDPYVYPGTLILRNLADIRDEERLERFESDHCFARLLELYGNPVCQEFVRRVVWRKSPNFSPTGSRSACATRPRDLSSRGIFGLFPRALGLPRPLGQQHYVAGDRRNVDVKDVFGIFYFIEILAARVAARPGARG